MGTYLKWILLLIGHAIELWWLQGSTASLGGSYLGMLRVGPLPGSLIALGVLVLGIYCDFGGHQMLFRGKMEFLPLMLISDFSTVIVLGSFVRLFLLVAAAK